MDKGMSFGAIARLSGLLARPFAGELFRLLLTYRDISASEAASRLELHIKTAQDFLDALCEEGISAKEEVFEKKRPYFRYRLLRDHFQVDVDLRQLLQTEDPTARLAQPIREKKDSGALFTTAANQSQISFVTIFSGKGRSRKERRISLTAAQGKFLFHLPFPTAAFSEIGSIMTEAGIDRQYLPEIIDMVDFLVEHTVIEIAKS